MPVQKYPRTRWRHPTHAGLSYETVVDKNGEVLSLSPGIYVENGPLREEERSKESPHSGGSATNYPMTKSYLDVYGPYQGNFVWVSPEGCQHCHSNVRNQFTAKHINAPYASGEGYQDFLQYLKENGVSDEDREAVKLGLATPQTTFAQEGLIKVIRKERELRCRPE
jgi:hypothetical protein